MRTPRSLLAGASLMLATGLVLLAAGCGGSTSSSTSTTGSAANTLVPPCGVYQRINRVLTAEGLPSVDPSLCDASEQLRRLAFDAVGQLMPSQRQTVYRLGHVQRTGAADDRAAAALAIATGFLRGAAGRALPDASRISPAEAARVLGPRVPSPELARIVQDAVDGDKEPPCEPPGTEHNASSGLAETGVQATVQSLAQGGDLQQAVSVALTKMFEAKACDQLREAIKALKRAAEVLTNGELVDRILKADAEWQHKPLPPSESAAYRQLRRQAGIAYVLNGAISELESESGGAIAAAERDRIAPMERPRPTDRALQDALAGGQLDDTAER